MALTTRYTFMDRNVALFTPKKSFNMYFVLAIKGRLKIGPCNR